MKDGEDADERAADVDKSLDDIGPDDSGESAFECVDEREDGDDGDGGDFSGAEGDGDDNGDGINADAFSSGARDEKKSGGERAKCFTEAALDQFIGGVKIAAKIMRKQNEADDDAADGVSEDELEKHEVGVISEAGRADDGECAGFSGDDGKADGPPGYVAVGEKVVAQGALFFAEAQAKEGDPDEIDSNDGEIEFVEAHVID